MTPDVLDQPTTALTGQPSWSALDIPPVKNAYDEQNVADYMNLAKSFQTRVEDFFRPHKQRAKAAHQGLCDAENAALQPAIDTEEACKAALKTYRRQLEEAARIERERLEAQARKIEEERRVREAAALEAAALANPDRAEAQEQIQQAEELITSPIHVVVQAEAPAKAAGAGYKDKFSAELQDKLKLLKAVAEQGAKSPQYLALFDLNVSAARKLAEMVKTDGKEILPGLICVRDINVSGKRR